MRNKNVRILMTSVGGLVVPNMFKGLRESFDGLVYIVGVDVCSEAVGFYFSDKSYVVLRGDAEDYSKQLLDIAVTEGIDVILPLSDEELLALARDKTEFEKKGIAITCSDYDILKTAMDKALMLEFLKEKGLPFPEFRLPSDIETLQSFVKELGYPEKKVIFKPRRDRGGRGFWLLNASLDKKDLILKNRDRQEITLEWLLESLDSGDSFPDILVMEYLPGNDFNIDVLALKGELLYSVPNQRLLPKAGPVQIGLVREDKKIQKLIREAVKKFRFDYYVNVEAAYREGDESEPFIYEINPRISAPIVINKAAGVDLLYAGVKMALGIKPSFSPRVRETKMIRYWNEIFIKYEKEFDAF